MGAREEQPRVCPVEGLAQGGWHFSESPPPPCGADPAPPFLCRELKCNSRSSSKAEGKFQPSDLPKICPVVGWENPEPPGNQPPLFTWEGALCWSPTRVVLVWGGHAAPLLLNWN